MHKEYKSLYTTKKRYTLVTGGRASLKSSTIMDFATRLSYGKNQGVLICRYTMTSAEKSIIPEFEKQAKQNGSFNDFQKRGNKYTNKYTDSWIMFSGIKTSQGDQTANLKSIPDLSVLIIDEGEDFTDEETFDDIDDSIRGNEVPNRVIWVQNPSDHAHFIFKRWIENTHYKREIENDYVQISTNEDVEHIHTTYRLAERLGYLSQSFLRKVEQNKKKNFPRYVHKYLGKWVKSIEGILWNRNIINQSKTKLKPNNLKTIVAIDPATTSNKTSDETGIVVCGALDGKYYVIDDLSGKYTPNEWAIVAHNAFKKYNCDMYVAEKNQGGDMVKSVLRQVDQRNHIKLVQATKGKYLRAEPIYSLYEQGKVFHVNDLPILENQMISFNPETNTQSPDRVDALVWGLTELSTQASGVYYIY